jgi:hypothetical protein
MWCYMRRRAGQCFERRSRGWQSSKPRPAGPQAVLLAAPQAAGAAPQPPGARRQQRGSQWAKGALAGANPVCHMPCPATMSPRLRGTTFCNQSTYTECDIAPSMRHVCSADVGLTAWSCWCFRPVVAAPAPGQPADVTSAAAADVPPPLREQRHAILTVQAMLAAAEAAADAAPLDGVQRATDPVADLFAAERQQQPCARWSHR